MAAMPTGFEIVLTASRAEMSQYGPEVGAPADAFIAFVSTFPNRYVRPIVRKFFVPMDGRDGRARFAPYSLRKIEALLGDQAGTDTVAVCHPDNMAKFVGGRTRLVGITTMDPLGLGYVSVTYNSLIPFGGETVGSAEFKKLMARVRALKKNREFKVVVGGEGTWQIEQSGLRAALGIDTLVLGKADAGLASLLEGIIAGPAPPVVRFGPGSRALTEAVPLIRRPAIYGDVEITRGCGRGCAFCSPNLSARYSVPLADVMREVEVNVRGGADSVFMITDDLFLYGAHEGFVPDRGAVAGLVEAIAGHPGVKWINLSHACLAPALIDKKLVSEIAPILIEKSSRHLRGKRYATVEVGLESGSVGIMRAHMPGKALPFKVEDWPSIVRDGIGVLNDNGIYPLGTIVVGWPGETEGDAIETARLLASLHDQGAMLFYTPVLFVPIERTSLERAAPASLEALSPIQLSIIERCWEFNVELWGGKVPKSWIRIIGLAAKAVGLGRRLTGGKSPFIHDRLGSYLLKARIPCDPGLCDRSSGS